MPRQADCFVVDPLHHAAVACNYPCFVIDKFIAEHGIQMPLGNRHTNCHGQALPQRSGGCFYALQFEIFRMACTWAAQLTKILYVIHRRARITSQMQRCIS